MTNIRNVDVNGVNGSGVKTPVRTDTAGRVKISQGQPPNITGLLSAVGQTVEIDMDGFSCFSVQLSGTYSGCTVVLEQSINGDDWVPLIASATHASSAQTSTLLSSVSNATVIYQAAAPSVLKVRVRMTARTSGTVNVIAAASTAAITTGIPTHAVTGTVTANFPTPTSHNYNLGASTSFTLVTNSTSANLDEFAVFNPTANPVYFKLYAKTTAPTTTDVPVMIYKVDSGQTISVSYPPIGKRFAGLGFSVTANPADNDNTAPAAGVKVSLTRH